MGRLPCSMNLLLRYSQLLPWPLDSVSPRVVYVLTTCTVVPVGRALRRRVLVEGLQDALLKVIHASQTKTNAAVAHASTGMGAFIARSHMNILQNASHQVAYVLTIGIVAMVISALRRRAHAEDTRDALLKVIHASQAKTHAAVAHASMGMGASFAKVICSLQKSSLNQSLMAAWERCRMQCSLRLLWSMNLLL